jgi:hypothetical protein
MTAFSLTIIHLLIAFFLPFAKSDHPSFDFSTLVNYPNSNNVSSDYQTPRPLKFQSWNSFQSPLSYTSEYICNVTLLAYEGSITARERLVPVSSYCNAHLDCVLGSISETIQANMASASVLLGLTPSILASVGPSFAEISMLSHRRPFLTFLISLGSPAIYPCRFATYEDPFGVYRPQVGALAIPPIGRQYSWIISACQYVLASGAALNVLKLSFDLGIQSVISWWCTFSFAPLFWTSLNVGIYLLAVLALRVRTVAHRSPRDQYLGLVQPEMKTTGSWDYLKTVAGQEIRLSANDTESREVQDSAARSSIAVALSIAAGWLAVSHIAFGTAVFSGLLFINIRFGVLVFVRYLASVTVCRMILSFEIGGMRYVHGGRVRGWVTQPEKVTDKWPNTNDGSKISLDSV